MTYKLMLRQRERMRSLQSYLKLISCKESTGEPKQLWITTKSTVELASLRYDYESSYIIDSDATSGALNSYSYFVLKMI